MIRNLAVKISRVFAEKSHAARIKCSVPIKITFDPLKTAAKMRSPLPSLFISGETYDVSTTGIAFIVSSIRVKEHYLVGQDRALIAELDVSGRKITMKLIGKRYERVGIHLSMEKYLIGAEIIDISDGDRKEFDKLISQSRSPFKKAAKPAFELGIE